nr:F-box only protein 31-like [Procambarus clarkii]XP_045605624.1 F-box only protein 31-like [Procambarus clarkii]XP_045605625.1 F-box only protein 31-like [Procambarus clarkii]XP_045605626.1 F-box only protein 31-like [Procambarus clarkii]XP_045605628.1 F-box only protein 31-like [Procambarus clarkii]XP_045605629.1 F-box only protein 31-like [Procambarus clarkii]
MAACGLAELPEIVLVYILRWCKARDLVALSSTCQLFYQLTAYDLLWKDLCWKDFSIAQPDLGPIVSYRKLYTNLLHKYGCILGVYQSQVVPCGGLVEIRYKAGSIEGVQWESSLEQNVFNPLKESIIFTIIGNEEPPKCVCIPNIYPHNCTLEIDKRKGIVTQHCSSSEKHITEIRDQSGFDSVDFHLEPRHIYLTFLNEVIGNGLVYKPLILPTPYDIPDDLKAKDGSFPSQIITPGLFQGSYGSHGLEIILFRFKDEYEIHGHKVTGDVNVHANKISVKILLKYPVSPSREDQRSLSVLMSMEPTMSNTPLSAITEQHFILPDDCHHNTITPIPTVCKARFHGFGQIAFIWFQRPSFTPVQVIVFNNDLLGVIWLELNSFSLYSRIKKTFTTNILQVDESAV